MKLTRDWIQLLVLCALSKHCIIGASSGQQLMLCEIQEKALHILTRQRFSRLIFWLYQRKFRISSCILMAALLIVAGIILDRLNTNKFLSDLRYSLEQEEHTIQAQLEGDIISKALLMRGFAATIASNPEISQERYAILAAQLIRDDPTILNIAAAPDLIVRYVYPQEPNKAVLGFDYRTSEIQLKEVERTRLVNGTVLAGPIDLVQGGQGFIFRAPVFVIDETTGVRKFWGIVSIVIGMDFLKKCFEAYDLDIALRKSTNREAFFGDNHVFNNNPLLSNIILPNGLWTMGIIPKGGWPTRADNFLPIRILLFSAGGLLLFLTYYIGKLLEKRKEAEQILTRAIEAIDGGFVLYDPDGVFVTCNQKYKEIYELSADLFRPGVTFEHIIREGMNRGEYPAITEQKEEWIAWRLERHKMADITDEHRLPNGHWIRVSETKLEDDSRVGIHIDITELMLAQKEAEQANQAKSAFLNTLSHELRTPLTIVLGYARILLNIEALPAAKELQASINSTPIDADDIQIKLSSVMKQVTQQSEKINKSGVHLLTLIADILDFSKADAGEMKFDKQAIPVGALVDAVLEQFKALAKEKNLQLSYQSNGETVFADELRTKQILINLVGNALKFTDAGSVTIKTRQKGSEVEFSVEDTGCGIPENETSAVFTEFHQIDGSDTRKNSGTGLGLSIVKQMVELQGGKVGLSSVLGKGSIFNFTLPSVAYKENRDNSTI